MNLYEELDRMTEPPSSASPVRILSREEIERLARSGAITPIESIPATRSLPRAVYPVWWFRGNYASWR